MITHLFNESESETQITYEKRGCMVESYTILRGYTFVTNSQSAADYCNARLAE